MVGKETTVLGTVALDTEILSTIIESPCFKPSLCVLYIIIPSDESSTFGDIFYSCLGTRANKGCLSSREPVCMSRI